MVGDVVGDVAASNVLAACLKGPAHRTASNGKRQREVKVLVMQRGDGGCAAAWLRGRRVSSSIAAVHAVDLHYGRRCELQTAAGAAGAAASTSTATTGATDLAARLRGCRVGSSSSACGELALAAPFRATRMHLCVQQGSAAAAAAASVNNINNNINNNSGVGCGISQTWARHRQVSDVVGVGRGHATCWQHA